MNKLFQVAAVTAVMLLNFALVSAAIPEKATPTKTPPAKVTQDKVAADKAVQDKAAKEKAAPVKAAEETPAPELVIKHGSRGDDVKRVQKLLSDAGYYAGELDGIFGNGTLRAVQNFQSYHYLQVDGTVGKETLAYMERASADTSRSEPGRYSRSLTMTATAYTKFDDGCGDKTYNGHTLRKGLVAVDPNVIPLGTRLFIPGYGYAIADDIGGAIKGHKIDLAFESLNDAFQFGRQKVTVYVID